MCQNQIARGGLPEEGMRIWFPYVATLFVFIWSMNLIGFIPLPFGERHVDVFGLSVPEFQIYAASANLSVTLALTLVKYFKSWMPSGLPSPRPFGAKTPAVLILLGLIAVIEVLSQFVRIVSLSFRLFFNMLAGHLVIAVFLGLASLLGTYFILPIGIPMGVALYLLECTLIAGLQAFIFATL